MAEAGTNVRYTSHVRGLPEAPLWLSAVVPGVVYPLLILSIFGHRPFYDAMQRKEGGVEWLTVLFLLIGVGYGATMLARYRRRLPCKWLVWWFGLATCGMFVLAGEEMSWGQHLGLWTGRDLPQFIQSINDQNESNFHNVSNALDQGPTNAVVIGTFVAFVLLPIYQRTRRKTMPPDDPGYWFWPTPACLPAALGVLLIPFPGRIYEWATDNESPQTLRHSEIHEFYIGLLMTTYMASAFHRLRAMPIPNEAPAEKNGSEEGG